jgi:hypothetical protein
MTRPILRRVGAMLVGALLATGALAQADEEREGPLPSPPGTVLSDAEPLPAEDRDSPGAIVNRDAPVRAQRAGPAQDDSGSVRAIGRNITQILGGPPAPPPPADAPPQDELNN